MIIPETLLHQTRLHFPRYPQEQVKISPIEKGGSGRRFYRIQFASDQSIVLVKYTREQTENQRYVEIANFLVAHEVRAPKIYFHDPEEGLIWIEDLGERDLWSYGEESWETRQSYYKSALEEAARLHGIARAESREIRHDLPAQFDAALYLWEQYYFFENCLGRVFGVTQEGLRALSELKPLQKIAEQLASYPRVLVHRDYQSQNIIVREGRCYMIDFQGMRPGLGAYDVASLLYDPYVSLTAAERAELLAFYQETAAISHPSFAQTYRFCAMQRLMQALGAYGYLGLAKGNTSFLGHIPTALESLGEILGEIEGVEPLGELVRGLARQGKA